MNSKIEKRNKFIFSKKSQNKKHKISNLNTVDNIIEKKKEIKRATFCDSYFQKSLSKIVSNYQENNKSVKIKNINFRNNLKEKDILNPNINKTENISAKKENKKHIIKSNNSNSRNINNKNSIKFVKDNNYFNKLDSSINQILKTNYTNNNSRIKKLKNELNKMSPRDINNINITAKKNNNNKKLKIKELKVNSTFSNIKNKNSHYLLLQNKFNNENTKNYYSNKNINKINNNINKIKERNTQERKNVNAIKNFKIKTKTNHKKDNLEENSKNEQITCSNQSKKELGSKGSIFSEHMKFLSNYKNFENYNSEKEINLNYYNFNYLNIPINSILSSENKEYESKFINYDLGKTTGTSLIKDSLVAYGDKNSNNNKKISIINLSKEQIDENEKTIKELENMAKKYLNISKNFNNEEDFSKKEQNQINSTLLNTINDETIINSTL